MKENPCELMLLTAVSANVAFKQACQEFVGWFLENTYYSFIKRVFVLLKPPNDVIGNLQQGIENKSEVANVPLQSNQEFFLVWLEANDLLWSAALRAVPATHFFIRSPPILCFLIPILPNNYCLNPVHPFQTIWSYIFSWTPWSWL